MIDTPSEVLNATYSAQIERIRKALSDRVSSKVARETGLHENTVRNIASGKMTRPSLTTVEKLTAYLFAEI